MSTSTRILKNSGYLYLKMAFTVFVNLYSTRLILNALGESDYGIIGVVGSIIGIITFIKVTLSLTTSRFINFYEGKGEIEKLALVFNNSFILHLLLSMLLCMILELAAPFIFDGVLNIPSGRVFSAKCVYHFSVVTLFFSILTVPYDSTINAHENMLYYAVVGVVESLLTLLIALYLTYGVGDKLIVYSFLNAVVSILFLFVKVTYCTHKYAECHLDIMKYKDKSQIKELLNFGKWGLLSTGGILIGNYGNSIVINHFFGTSLNAAQSIATQIKGQVMALTTTMTRAVSPVITKRAGAGDISGMLRISLTATKLNIFLYAILGIPFMIEAPFILKIWLKNVPDWALCFSVFEVAVALSEQFSLTFHTTLISTGKIKGINTVNFLTHIIPLFIYFVIFSMGAQPYWMYILYAIAIGVITNSADVFFASKHCNLNLSFYRKDLFLPCLICIVIAILIGESTHLYLNEGWIKFFLSCFLAEIFYLVSMYYWGFNREERSLINGILCKVLKRH